MEPIVALEDGAAHIQHSLDCHHEDRIVAFDRLADACFLGTSSDGSDEQPAGPERTTSVAFDID